MQMLETLGCWSHATGDLLLAMTLILGIGWLVTRHSLLGSPHTMPLLKLFIGLGVLCGLAGSVAVIRLGGVAVRWWLAWEALIGAHLLCIWQEQRLHQLLSSRLGGHDSTPARMLMELKMPAFLCVLAVCLWWLLAKLSEQQLAVHEVAGEPGECCACLE